MASALISSARRALAVSVEKIGLPVPPPKTTILPLSSGDGLVAGEALGHLGHEGAGHNDSVHTLLVQGVLDGQCVHNGGQHTDLVGVHAVHFAAGTAAPEVAAAHHNGDLGAQVVRGLDARADGGDGFLIKAGSLGAGECLAADFQKNTFILNCHKKHHL